MIIVVFVDVKKNVIVDRNMMNKYWISFGQTHVHSVNGKTFDKDCLAEVEAHHIGFARDLAIKYFELKWANIYDELEPDLLEYFPRGVIKVN